MKRFVCIFIFAFLLFPMVVFAQNVEIKEVKMIEKSENAEIVANPKINELAIDFNIKLNALNDYVKYKVILNNKDDIDYIISKSDFEDNEYISYDIESDNLEKLEAKKEKVIYLKIKYEKKIPEEVFLDNKYVLSNNFSFTLDDGKEEIVTTNKTTNKEEQIKNPETGIKDYGIIVGVSIGVLAIVIYCFNRNKKFFKPLVLFLSFSFLIYPVVGKAIILMKFSMETTVTIEKGVALYEISINPNGGIYEDKEEITKVKLINGKTYNVSKPKREGFIFSRWEVEGKTSSVYDKETDKIKIVSSDILLKAIWVSESNIIAKIKETGIVYESIQAAYEAAKDKETVILMNDTTENTINTKNITFDLNGHTQSGSLENKGDILLYGGSIKSEDIAIKNEGTLTLGFDDGEVNSYECKVGEDKGCVSVIGKNQGIDTQNGTFNFYDGYIKGTIGIVGGCKKTPYSGLTDDGSKLYYHATVDNDKNGYQYVYLTDSSKAVSKTITNGEVYYYNLQDNFNSSMISGYEVYAVRNFEAAYILSVNEDKKILFDVNGYNVQTGNDINNNGTLELTNSNKEKGRIESSHSIINNGILKLEEIEISGSTNVPIVVNNKNLEMKKSTINGTTGYGVSANESTGTIKMDDDSIIASTSNAGLYISKDVTQTITNGNVKSEKSNGIYNVGTLTLENVNVISDNGACVYNYGGEVTVENGTYLSTQSYAVNNYSGLVTINDGKFNSTRSAALYNNSKMIINNGVFHSDNSEAIYNYRATITIDNCDSSSLKGNALRNIGGVVTVNSGNFISDSSVAFYNTYASGTWSRFDSTVVINGGFFKSNGMNNNAYAIENDSNISINGGKLESANAYGIYHKYGILNIGTNDGVIDIDSPFIKGITYGVYLQNGTMNFYDGVLKGKTSGYYGTFSTIEDATVIKTSNEIIDGDTFITNYLENQIDFLEVNGKKYNSFEKAISSIENKGTIKVINNATINYGMTIPKEKEIILDLNGKTVSSTVSINNEGKLNVVDTSSAKNGCLANTKLSVINNKYSGELIIDDGTIKSTNASALDNNGGIVTINKLNIESESIGLSNSSGTMTIKNVTIVAKSDGISARGMTTIENANVTSESTALSNYRTTVIVNGGTFKSKKSYAIYNIGGTLTINDGTFVSENSTAFYNNYDSGIWSTFHTNVTINGGTIKSLGSNSNAYGIHNYSNMKIIGGEIESTSSYGLYCEYYQTTIGSNDGIVVKASPSIKGKTYGLYIRSGTINFYDGILKGIDGGYYGNISSIEDGTIIKNSTENIENQEYKLNYLENQVDFLEVSGKTYNSFEKAINSIEESGTIKVIATVQINYGLTIPKEKDIILDLNGNSITSTITIGNSGKLNVIDSSSLKNGALINTKAPTISNVSGGELTVDAGLFKTTTSAALSNENGKLVINSAKIESDSLGVANSSGTMNIKSITVNSKGTAIAAQGTVIIDDANVTTESNAIDISSGNVTINGGSFYSSKYYVINNYGGTLTINDGTFISDGNVAFYNRYSSGTWSTFHTNVTINGGLIKSNGQNSYSYAISNNSKIKINGGTIESLNAYGIYNESNELTIGTNDGNVSTSSPVIKGETYGLYIKSGTVGFYDGLLKGKTGGYFGVISDVEKNYDIETYEEKIDDAEYHVSCLKEISDIVINKNTQKKYLNLQDAIDEVTENQTLSFIKNANIYNDVTISNEKNVTIDLNGYDIYITKKITNGGSLNLVNSGTNLATIHNPTSMPLVTNNNVLYINNICLRSDYAYALYNNKEANIEDSNLSGYGGISNSKTGSVVSVSSTYGGTYTGIYNSGKLNLTETTISADSYGIYIDAPTISEEMIIDDIVVTQKNGTSGTAIYNHSGMLKVNNLRTNGGISNYTKSTLNVNTGTIGYRIGNDGTMSIVDVDLNYDESGSNYTSTRNILANTGTLTISNSSITSLKINYGELRGLYNTGDINASDFSIELDKNNTSGNLYGIYNEKGTINLDNLDMSVVNGTASYGIYVKNGDVSLKSGTISAQNNKTNAYGIYIENGTVTMGEKEDESGTNYGTINADVSVTNPSIKAISNTLGIGVKRVNGYFNYYDGIITGSTNAKPDVTSTVEYKYQVENHVDPATGYEYCILEYMKE